MSKVSEDWSSIIERYKSSGLSQREFCTQHDVPWNQFHYRWSRYRSALKPKTRVIPSESKATSLFEAGYDSNLCCTKASSDDAKFIYIVASRTCASPLIR